MTLRGKIWGILTNAYPALMRRIYKMDLGEGVRIAHKAHLDKSINPKGVHIGDRTWVLSGAYIMAHDYCRALKTDTYIGHDCVIGVNAIIMPGVHIGDEVVIGSGAIVTKDIPSNSIAAGNPAKVLKSNIHVFNGQLKNV